MVRQFFNHINQEDIFEKLTAIRRILDAFPDRIAMGEVGLTEDAAGLAASYCGDGLLHTAYNFSLLTSDTNAEHLRDNIQQTLVAFSGKLPSWTIGNHDVKRVASRFSRGQLSQAAVLRNMVFLCVLPGLLCLYQGDELGLPQADLSYDELVDPYDKSMYPNHEGRDGARTPMPWEKNRPHAGFSTAKPWLKVDEAHYALAVDQQQDDANSVLNFTRQLLALRKNSTVLQHGDCHVESLSADVLMIVRSFGADTFYYAFNFGLKASTVNWNGRTLTIPAQGYHTNDTSMPVPEQATEARSA